MATKTTKKTMMIAIRNEIQEILETELNLKNIVKIYSGMPNSIPNYPAIVLAWDRKENQQISKGEKGRRYVCHMNIVVLHKYLNFDEMKDKLLKISGFVEDRLIEKRYLNGLRDANGKWKTLQIETVMVDYEALLKPKTFVLDSSEIKAVITAEDGD